MGMFRPCVPSSLNRGWGLKVKDGESGTSMSYLATGFEDVDDTGAIQTFTHCLRLQQSLEFYHRYKQKTFNCLHLSAGALVLEVGCGTGEDAIALAKLVGSTGKVTAVDRSQAMVQAAIASTSEQTLPIDFVVADAQQLPFADNSFDAARVDRTLQHVADPQRAIAEMARVLRPGGWMVAMEPDWETFIVDSNNRIATRQFLNFWCDSFPSGWVGRCLFKYFHQARLTDIQVNPETLVITQFDLADQIFDLVQTAHGARDAGIVSQSVVQAWLDELRQLDQSQQFFCSFTAMIVSGKK